MQVDTSREKHLSSIFAAILSLLLLSAGCSGDAGIDVDEDVFTPELRSQLDPFIDFRDPGDDPFISVSEPADRVDLLNVDEFVLSFKAIVRGIRASAARVAESGTFDADSWEDENTELLAELEAWITERIGRAQPDSREYLIALMWALRHPPPAFDSALENKFGPQWFEERFDEIYDEYYVDLARIWLDVNSSSKPASLQIAS